MAEERPARSMSQLPTIVLKRIPLFSELEPTELNDVVLRLAKRLTWEAGDAIVRQGEPGDAMYIIEIGKASVRIKSGAGQSVTVATLGPGEIIGELSLIDSAPRSADVIAETVVHGFVIRRDRFAALRAEYNSATQKIMRQMALALCKRLRRVNEHAAQMVGGADFADVTDGPPEAGAAEKLRGFWKNVRGWVGG